MQTTKKTALCGLMAAVSSILLLLGSVLGLGIYAAPMFCGMALIPIGFECGKRYQLLTWLTVSLLCLLFVPDWEEKLMYCCLLGWYPALQPSLNRIPQPFRIIVKLAVFNSIIIALEALLLLVLLPETNIYGKPLLLLLLLFGNAIFLLYDLLIPRVTLLYTKRLRFRLIPGNKRSAAPRSNHNTHKGESHHGK